MTKIEVTSSHTENLKAYYQFLIQAPYNQSRFRYLIAFILILKEVIFNTFSNKITVVFHVGKISVTMSVFRQYVCGNVSIKFRENRSLSIYEVISLRSAFLLFCEINDVSLTARVIKNSFFHRLAKLTGANEREAPSRFGWQFVNLDISPKRITE